VPTSAAGCSVDWARVGVSYDWVAVACWWASHSSSGQCSSLLVYRNTSTEHGSTCVSSCVAVLETMAGAEVAKRLFTSSLLT
jgi:hypothetical protein